MSSRRARPGWLIAGSFCLALLGCGRTPPSVPVVVETMPVTVPEEEEAWPTRNGFTIRIKEYPDSGKRLLVRHTQQEFRRQRVQDMAGKLQREEETSRTRDKTASLSVLERDALGPRRLSLTIENDTITQEKIANPGPTQGRTLVLEFQNNRWNAAVKSGPPLPKAVLEAVALDLQTRLLPVLLPRKPVNIGDRWPINEALLLDRFAALGAVAPASGAALLARVQPQDGRQQGRLEFSLTLTVRDTRTPQMQQPCTLAISGTLDAALDGSSTATTLITSVKLTGGFLEENPKGKLQVLTTVETQTTEERSEEK